jgi:K+-sensing histidine kinase KdpD
MGSRVGKDKVNDSETTSQPPREPPSDVWTTVSPHTYNHMANVASDARDLLGALSANVQWLRAAVGEKTPAGQLGEGLSDIETCCERLNNMLEDALVGVRRDGLEIQRSKLSFESVLAAAMKQVTKRAEARAIAFRITTELDVVAKLDRTLITRALVKVMSSIISESAAKAEVAVTYVLERGVITITFVRIGTFLSGPPILRPPTEARGAAGDEADLAFCRLVIEGHGGALTVGTGSTLYRVELPWIAG